MLLTIHNLPARTQYSDVEDLVIDQCGLKDSIIGKLQDEDGGSSMQATVGVAEEEDAAILVRKINGLYYRGQQLFVENKRQKKGSQQPYNVSIVQQSQEKQTSAKQGKDINTHLQPPMSMYQAANNYISFQPQNPGQVSQESYGTPNVQQSLEKQATTQQGYDLNSYLQASLSMYQPAAYYFGCQPQTPQQTGVQNTNLAYGGQQTQSQQFLSPNSGASSKFIQQPNAPLVKDNSADIYFRRAASPGRLRSREGRSGHDNRRRSSLPTRGRDATSRSPDHREPPAVRNERPEYAKAIGYPKYMYAKSQYDNYLGFNSSNSDGDHTSMSQDMRGDRSANSRDNRDRNSSMSRDFRGDDSGKSRDTRGGHSSMSRDVRGDYSSNSREVRGGDSSSSREMRRDRFADSRVFRRSSKVRDMRGSHTSNFRDKRDGYSPHAQKSQREPSREKRGGQKRRWEESTTQSKRGFERPAQNNSRKVTTQRQSRPLYRDEPRSKKFASQPPLNLEGNNAGQVSKQDNDPTKCTARAFKLSIMKGANKVIYSMVTRLNLLCDFEGPSPLKTELRKTIVARVSDLFEGGTKILTQDEILACYRTHYPESDDEVVYNSVMQKLAAAVPDTTKQAGAPNTSNQDVEVKITNKEKKHQKRYSTPEPLNVPPRMQKAIKDEINLIGEVLEDEFTRPRTQSEQDVYSNLDQEDCIFRCKKLVKYHLSRRITDTGLKLLRVSGRPILPKLQLVREFLKQYGCLSLRKASKTAASYTASFDSYATVDELCNMNTALLGDVNNTVLKFHYMSIAPKQKKIYKMNAKRERRRYVVSLKDHSNVNLLDKDWQTVEKQEKEFGVLNNIAEDWDDIPVAEDRKIPETKIKYEEEVVAKEERNVSADNNDDSSMDNKVVDKEKKSDNDVVLNEGLKNKGLTETIPSHVKDDVVPNKGLKNKDLAETIPSDVNDDGVPNEGLKKDGSTETKRSDVEDDVVPNESLNNDFTGTKISDVKDNVVPNENLKKEYSTQTKICDEKDGVVSKENIKKECFTGTKVSEVIDNVVPNQTLNLTGMKVSEVKHDVVPNEVLKKEVVTGKKKSDVDDWDEAGENWGDIGNEANARNNGEEDSDDDVVGINNGVNVGGKDIEDIDWDDVNEDDLEDY